MSDIIDETEEPIEDEEELVADDLDEAEPSEAELADATVPPDPAAAASGAEVESIQELLVKQEAAEEEERRRGGGGRRRPHARGDGWPSPPTPASSPSRRPSSPASSCFLVKHRSQLADKKKMLCRDCA